MIAQPACGFIDLGTIRRLWFSDWNGRADSKQLQSFCLGKQSSTVFKLEFEISLRSWRFVAQKSDWRS